MKCDISQRAQTATEYLIISAVVIIIALIVVNAFSNIPSLGSGTTTNAEILKLRTGLIGVEEYVLATNNSLITIRNNFAKSIRVTAVAVNTIACTSTQLPTDLAVGGFRKIVCTNIDASSIGSSYDYDISFNYTFLDVDAEYSFTPESSITGTTLNGTVSDQGFFQINTSTDEEEEEGSSILSCIGFHSYTNVSACGTLSASGCYALNQSITGGTNCLIVAANNVMIDGNGYTITGGVNATNDTLSASAFTNLTLKNVTVSTFVTASNRDQNPANGTVIGNAGELFLVDTTVSTVSANGGHNSYTVISNASYRGGNAGNITLLRSVASTIQANGGDTIHSGRSGMAGIIILNTSTGGTIQAIPGYKPDYSGVDDPIGSGAVFLYSSNATYVNVSGHSTLPFQRAIDGGNVTVVNSIITSYVSADGGSAGLYGSFRVPARGGKINISSSTVGNIFARGGSCTGYSCHEDNATGGVVTISGATSVIGDVTVRGGDIADDADESQSPAGNGGNITIVACQSIGTQTCSAGTSTFPGAIAGSCASTC